MNIVEQFSPRLIGGFLAMLGAWVVAMLVRSLRLGRASLQWPHTQGTVTNSLVKRELSGPGGGYSYVPLITYTYEVDGAAYEGNTFTYRGINAKKKIATKIVEGLPKGQLVDVYYDPSEPSRAVLLPGASTSSYVIGFAIAVFIAVVGLLLVLWGAPTVWFCR